MFVILLIILFLILFKFSKMKPNNFPPGPPRLPIWGSYWFLLKEDYTYLHKALPILGRKYNTDILGFYLGDAPAVVTLNLELSKELLTRPEFIGRNDTIYPRMRSNGNLRGIFFVDGPLWKEQRRFCLRYMREYGFGRRSLNLEEYTLEHVKDLVDMFASEPKPQDLEVYRKKGIVFFPDVLYASFLNVILMVLAGRRYDNVQELREVSAAILKFLRSIDATGNALNITPWLRHIAPGFFKYNDAVESNEIMVNFIKKILKQHKNDYSDDHHNDFIDVYINKQNEIGSEILQESSFADDQFALAVVDFMFPAPVALGHTMAYLVAYFFKFPDVQTNVQNELDRVVGRGRLPTLDDRQKLPYTEATLREVMRRYPITPFGLARRCIEDTTLGGYSIPKDTVMLACLSTAHMDEKIFEDPEIFRPERFLDKNGELLKKDYTIPFGAGKRLCAGETFARNTLFLYATGLLQNFTFKCPEDQPLPDLEEQIPGIVTALPEFWVQAVPRD